VLMAYGREMVVEGGIYMYDASQWRRYVLGPNAHNVVFVDGEGQHRRDTRETYTTDKPVPMVWQSGPHCDYVRAAYGEPPEGFGEKKIRPAIHRRRILFVKRGTGETEPPGDFWIVADSFNSLDGEAHRYESVFHIDAPDLDVDSATHAVTTKYEQGPQLGIFPLSVEGIDVEVVRGQEGPVLQGWLPLDSKTHTGVRPIPTPVFRIEGPGVRRLLYVFLPVENGPVPAVTVTPWDGSTDAATAVEIAFENGARVRVAFPDDAARPCTFGAETFQGEALVEKAGVWRETIEPTTRSDGQE